MNLKKVLLSSVAALALTSTAAFAAGANNGSNVVAVANDGTGDYLVMPAYFANSSGWSTNLKVVNSNTTHAVIGKVVIRESVDSEEKLDFPIYLSPGDVWEGTLSYLNGAVVLSSNDDSMLSTTSPLAFANTTPVTKALSSAVDRQNINMGYVEVFGIAAINGNDDNIGGTTWTTGPIAKSAIYNKFVAELNGNSATNDANWTHVDNNSLYGQAVISAANANGNLAMTIPATALENVTGTDEVDQLTIGADTLLTRVSNITDKDALVQSIEAALAKSNVFVTTYENADASDMAQTVLLLNQPAKKMRYAERTAANMDLADIGYVYTAANTTFRAGTNDFSGATDSDVTSDLDTTGTGSTTVANKAHNWSFVYVATPRDQSENHPTTQTDQYSGYQVSTTTTRCNTELCYLDVDGSGMSTYVKGYVDVAMSLPTIPVVMTAKSVGGTNITNIVYPAYRAK